MPESFSIGNENLGGRALRVEARVERGRAYQTAIGGRIEKDVLFGHPFRFVLDADRYQIDNASAPRSNIRSSPTCNGCPGMPGS